MILSYVHHGKTMYVRQDLKGHHKDYCLCYSCEKMTPGKPDHCLVAQGLYDYDCKHGVTTPVFECSLFVATKQSEREGK